VVTNDNQTDSMNLQMTHYVTSSRAAATSLADIAVTKKMRGAISTSSNRPGRYYRRSRRVGQVRAPVRLDLAGYLTAKRFNGCRGLRRDGDESSGNLPAGVNLMAETMKAFFIVPSPEGGVYELRDIPIPAPGPGEVLVKIHGTGPIAAS